MRARDRNSSKLIHQSAVADSRRASEFARPAEGFKSGVGDWRVVIITVAALATIVAASAWHNSRINDGHWILALDDPYIHLAMARTFSQDGVWGISPGAFSASSSSPLYLLFLSTAFLTGWVSEFWAWLFAAVGGLVCAGIISIRVAQHIRARLAAVVISLFACIVIGLPEIMLTGMEHALHICAVLSGMILLERRLTDSATDMKSDWLLGLSFLLAAAMRYETLFLLPAAAWLLWRSNRRSAAVVVAIAGILPALILGALHSLNGALFLPNSIILKGVMTEGSIFDYAGRFQALVTSPPVLLLITASSLWWLGTVRKGETPFSPQSAASVVFLVAVLLHAAFARGDLRYTGYLMAAGIWSLMAAFAEWGRGILTTVRSLERTRRVLGMTLAVAVGICAVLFPFLERITDLGRLRFIGQDIYAQQYQMAQFLSTYYDGQPVGLNDIGAVAWAGRNPILDLRGLGDDQVARMRFAGELGPEQLAELARARDVKVVAIYSHWFLRDQGLPEQWQLVGRWQIPTEIQMNSASNTVDFFATTPEAVEALRHDLQDFSAQLPPNVKVIL